MDNMNARHNAPGQAEADMQSRIGMLTALNRLIRAVTRSLDPDEVIDAALTEILQSLKPDLAMVFLSEGSDLVLKGAIRATPLPDDPGMPPHRIGECLCGLAVATGEPVYASDIRNDPRCTWHECKHMGMRAAATLPLQDRDTIFGFLVLASRIPRDFGQEKEFLETVAGQFSAGLKNSLLYRQLQLQHELQQHREHELRESDTRLRSIIDNAPFGAHSYELLPDGQLIFSGYNKAADEILGIDHALLIGQTIEQAFPMLIGSPVPEIYKTVAQGGESNNIDQIDYDDGSVHGAFEVYAFGTGPHRMTALFRDITERKRAELALFESEKKFRFVVQNAPAIFFILDQGGVFLLSEGKSLARLSLLPGQAVGLSAFDLYREYPSISSSIRMALDGEVTRTVNEIGGVVFDTVYAPYYDSSGLQIGVIGVAVDITEQKKLEHQLLRAQKMEAIGTLAGGIAHDFNNVLQAMAGYLSMFLQRAPSELDVSYVKKAESMIDRAADLTRGLLAFSRKQQADMYLFDLNELVGQFHALIARVIGEHIILHVRLAPGALNIMGNYGLLEQVLMNMAINARDAMPAGGELRVEVDAIELSDAAAIVNGCDHPGSYARISITDTGAGMDYETSQKIFDPFFTTKEVGKGTGLGLAISYGTVREHGGNITVYSESGVGTTFRIYLPLSGTTPAFAQQEQLDAVLGGTETVLFVEDFEPARETMRIVLEGHGYKVIEAVDGEDALVKFRASPHAIDIVVTDVIMPNMNGKEMADHIRREQADMKFIFVSGYTPETLKEKWHEQFGIVMAKPFSPALLARKVREVLDEVRR